MYPTPTSWLNLYYLKGNKDSVTYYARLSNNELLLNIFSNDKAGLNKIIIKKSRENGITSEEIANYYAKVGEKDSAFVWLNKSVQNKEYGGLKFLAVSPYFDPLRSDPRFDLLLQNSGIRWRVIQNSRLWRAGISCIICAPWHFESGNVFRNTNDCLKLMIEGFRLSIKSFSREGFPSSTDGLHHSKWIYL